MLNKKYNSLLDEKNHEIDELRARVNGLKNEIH